MRIAIPASRVFPPPSPRASNRYSTKANHQKGYLLQIGLLHTSEKRKRESEQTPEHLEEQRMWSNVGLVHESKRHTVVAARALAAYVKVSTR